MLFILLVSFQSINMASGKCKNTCTDFHVSIRCTSLELEIDWKSPSDGDGPRVLIRMRLVWGTVLVLVLGSY